MSKCVNARRLVVAGCVALSLASASAFAAAKQYQFTGKIIEMTDKVLTVAKGDEKSEFDRTPDLKVTGTLKVGEKVTIYYHMVADKAEVKTDAKMK